MPTLVQSKSGTITTGTSLSITLTSGTTATNCLIAGIGAVQGTTNPTASGITLGGGADHWASAKSLNNNSETDAEIWSDQGCAGGQTAVVISFNAGSGTVQGNGAWIEEWSGIATSGALDATNGAVTSNASTFNSGSTGVLAQASELVIGCVCAEIGAGTITVTGPGAPWTNQAQLSPVSQQGVVVSSEVVSSTAAQTYSGTTTAASVTTAVIATFKAAAAAAPSGTPQPRATVPVPRRGPSRAVVQASRAVPAAPPAGRRQAPYTPPRRRLARAVIRGTLPPVPAISTTGIAQPRPTITPLRRRLARAIVQFIRTPGAVAPPPPPRTLALDDGDPPWHIRIRRRRT